MRSTRSIAPVVFAVVALASIAACSSGGAATQAPSTQAPRSQAPASQAPASQASSAVQVGEPFIIKTPAAEPQACMDALMTGRLVQHPLSGLGVAEPNGQAKPVEWPFGYTARIVAGRVELLDETGKVVANENDEISMGGGFGNQFWHACGPVVVPQVAS